MKYSSTSKYANRYDLDEIDVFLEGNSNNPMFFSVDGLPNQLSYGKHYFYLSILNSQIQEYRLRNQSRILFEFKSINGVVIKSDVTNVTQKNGVATCFVEVLQNPLRTYDDIDDGEGTLTIVGSIEDKDNSNMGNNSTPIPEKFRGAINYRCVFPIQIRKNLINADSPKIVQSEHKLQTTLGRFSFGNAHISTPKGSTRGQRMSPTGTPTISTLNITKRKSIY